MGNKKNKELEDYFISLHPRMIRVSPVSWKTKCIFCGRDEEPKQHMYICIGEEGSVGYHCFECKKTGKLTDRMLKEIGGDTKIPDNLSVDAINSAISHKYENGDLSLDRINKIWPFLCELLDCIQTNFYQHNRWKSIICKSNSINEARTALIDDIGGGSLYTAVKRVKAHKETTIKLSTDCFWNLPNKLCLTDPDCPKERISQYYSLMILDICLAILEDD